ncbi:hemolysin III family protein [uncultured Bacteroides sp.]|uniref:PAQR family membrane homeostasis protein TrhA n=1 Tax=uncultured Bacteroides sp. TaxID=162156 RepID=UPI002AAB95A3|nr:hemolysin III family protein [uncultured Bacteroides sp.]
MNTKRYTPGEELANTLSHGIGILFGLIAGYFLLKRAQHYPDPWAVLCVSIYLLGMLSSYISSTWYHGTLPGKRKELLRKFDHAAIYWHIAGTYTPFTLITMRNAEYWGWGVFSFVWIAAIVGTILSFKKLKEHSNLETICYVAMGSAILIAMKPLSQCLQNTHTMNALWWLIAGGVSYIIGALFYSFRKIRYMHSVFHLFCLGGSICHIISIWIIL